MERTGLRQPYMAVDASTLIEPPLLESGIRANTDRANAARPFLIETIALTFLSIDDFRYQFFSFCLDFSASAFSLFTLS